MVRYRTVAGKLRHSSGYRASLPRLDDKYLAVGDSSAQSASCELDDSAIAIFDQMSLGSCTANGGCFQAAWLARKAGVNATYSRLFLYAMTRMLEGTPLTEDSGAEPRDVFLALAQYGVCEEALWPYFDNKIAFAVEPPKAVKVAAAKHQALMFFRCVSVESIKQSIVDGFPVGFGATLYESFDSDAVAANGLVPVPAPGEKATGGHYMVVMGFSDTLAIKGAAGTTTGAFKVRNSWGNDWGAKGYCWIPYDYWRSGLVHENWTLRRENV